MIEKTTVKIKSKIKRCILFFIVFLVASGLTAFPIEWELKLLKNAMQDHLNFSNPLYEWISEVYQAVHLTNLKYPFLAYGTDWLAFAHLVIAVAFIGPLRDPVRNIWVIQFGMIACVMIFPLAFIAGSIRSIPFFWILIDCSFGIFGLVPLYWCYKNIQQLELLEGAKKT